MIDLKYYLPSKRKNTASGWISFDAPCCVHNGETADRRQRGGIMIQADGSWSYHCFNCGYKTSFVVGRTLSYRARKLLNWLNVPNEEVERINLESLRQKSIADLVSNRQHNETKDKAIVFDTVEIDSAAGEIITQENDPDLWQYLRERAIPEGYPIAKSTSTRAGIVVPFTFQGSIVGYTTRFLDDRRPKYIHNIQSGYVFGTDLQATSWEHVIVVEGVFDALAINAIALLHADINDAQVRLIRSLGKEITLVPDQDATGLKLVDRAIELGWAVSMPEWKDCKDVNDAVKKYGRLATLMSIMQARETNRVKIELRRRQVAKRI